MLVPLTAQWRNASPDRELEIIKACRAGWEKAKKSKPGGSADEKAKRAFRASKLPAPMRDAFVGGYLRSRELIEKRTAA